MGEGQSKSWLMLHTFWVHSACATRTSSLSISLWFQALGCFLHDRALDGRCCDKLLQGPYARWHSGHAMPVEAATLCIFVLLSVPSNSAWGEVALTMH